MPWLDQIKPIHDRFRGSPHEVELNRSLVRHWLNGHLQLDAIFGDFAIGMVLLEAHFSSNPDVDAEYVVERLNGFISDDTARRKLAIMEKEGIVMCSKNGRTRFYRIKPHIAAASIAFIKGDRGHLQESSA